MPPRLFLSPVLLFITACGQEPDFRDSHAKQRTQMEASAALMERELAQRIANSQAAAAALDAAQADVAAAERAASLPVARVGDGVDGNRR